LLKLKRVEIQGFKSFCDRTELRFNGAGITAVVGPNGCGKSNLSDAISWVLGEQSAKTLRGTRMQDVIFAGTNTRKPLGMASVTMTLVDPAYQIVPTAPQKVNGNGAGAPGTGNGSGIKGHGADKPQEITITRRLFRSGESEYLINGRPARLRDIQELFMGTGLGPESYAIIEQGRIGQILSTRPQDRRAVIEEAAGVSKFKSRRRLAEAKLEGARQNLSRVFDILEEVGRQVNSLKRQARKAERYQKLRAEMLVELRRTLTGRFRMLEREAGKTALELNLAAAEYQKLTDQVREKENEQRGTQQQAYATESGLTKARGRLGELRVETERTRGKMEAQAAQIADIEARLTQGETETQSLEGRAHALSEQLVAQGRALAQLEAEAEAARRKLTEKLAERQSAEGELQRQEQVIETARQSVLRLLGEAAQLKNELAQIDEYLASLNRDAARAEKEREMATAETVRLEKVRGGLSEKLAARRAELEAVTRRRRTVEQELTGRKTRLTEARGRLEELRSQTSTLRARKESLEEILSHRAYTTEAVKRLFTAIEQGQGRELEPLGVLADFVDVDPKYEKAAEAFLHEELEYVVVKDWSHARAGIELMRRELDGRVTFLVHPAPDAAIGGVSGEPPLGPETGIVARLSSVLRMTNGLTHAPAELVPRIARCLIAADHTAARRLAERYPDFYFLLADGVCYHGYAVSGGKKASAGPLALKRELRELKSLVRSRQKELEEVAAVVSTLEEEIARFSDELEGLRSQQQGREKEVVAIEHEVRKLDEEHARASQRRSVAETELERLRREKERARQQRSAHLEAIEEREQARQAQEKELAERRLRRQELRERVAKLSEEHSALRVELAEREERRRSERETRQRLESERREVISRRDEVAAEMERLGVERARLLADNIELDSRAAELAREIAAAEQSVHSLEEQEGKLRETLAALEEALKQLRAESQAVQEKRSQIEVALAERRAELRYLDETAGKELNASLQQLADSDEEVLDEEALAHAEENYDRLKARIEALGPVNPQALEEYEDAKQRYDFLNAQRQDLLDSIRDTEKAIHDIDVETRKRFSRAFEAINENFRHSFRILFGGGTGEMRLSDPSNLADSGVDIVASPPGKRLQNVLLLSGGEKALTALALLMATFQYQPSPFCVLDEVDAPLDETNIERLLLLLKDMARQTQFIVITHAKRTMQASESLYGVTMQEPGVSKLVSVKFEEPREERQTVESRAALAR